MSTARPTFDDVWQMFQETARRFQETDRKFQETDRKFQETDRKFQESERSFKEHFAEIDRRFQETERVLKEQMAETKRVLKEHLAETERVLKEQSAETERVLKEQSADTDRKMKDFYKKLGDIGNRLGEFVENMVESTVVKLFQAQGVAVHEVHSGVQVEREGDGIEIDLLVVNDGAVVAVECKSKLTKEHVNTHMLRMKKLKHMLPAYRHHQAFGAVAAMVVHTNVAKYAQQQGFYVLAQSGESVEVRNDIDFHPKEW